MNDKLDNYNKLVDLIGNIIKATSEKDLEKALDIAHTVGNTLKAIVNKNDNTASQYENNR